MFSILDGREEFYQWDKDRKIIVKDSSIKEVHFCNKTDDCSLVVATYQEGNETLANVPNILLQTDWKIRVFGYTGDYTKYEACFKVNGRSKPADYVYTETEIKSIDSLLEHTKDTKNPHKITPEIIKALSSEAQWVDDLDEATETGIYIGKMPSLDTGMDYVDNQTFYCMTFNGVSYNGETDRGDYSYSVQLCFGEDDIECYGQPAMFMRIMYDWNDDDGDTPYWESYKFLTSGEIWEYGFATLDDLFYELEYFYEEYISGISGPRIYEGEYGNIIVEYNDRIELFATAAENISHSPHTGLAIQFPIEINIESGDNYNAQATISVCEGKETINEVSVTGQWVWIGFNTDLPEDDITQSHYVEAYLHVIKFFDVEEE